MSALHWGRENDRIRGRICIGGEEWTVHFVDAKGIFIAPKQNESL